jgi:hypothetical protein
MSRVRIRHVIGQWAFLADGPKGGTIGDDGLSYSWVVKYQGGAVYDSLALALEWPDDCDEWVAPILEELRPYLKRAGLQRRDVVKTQYGAIEVWFAPTYSSRDNLRKFERACATLGWKKIVTGWWPGDNLPPYLKEVQR